MHYGILKMFVYSVVLLCAFIKYFCNIIVAYRMYNYSIFPATSVGEGPSADGSFLTRENSELTNTSTHCNFMRLHFLPTTVCVLG